jgi:PhnO protein
MIKEVSLEYFNEIYKLICELENKQMDKLHFDKVFKYQLADNNYKSYVYIQDNQVVGYISLLIKHTLHHNGLTGEILELIVEPTYRNNNVGKQLIEYVKEVAHCMLLEELELCTSTWREDAHRFYENNDFVMNHYNFISKI